MKRIRIIEIVLVELWCLSMPLSAQKAFRLDALEAQQNGSNASRATSMHIEVSAYKTLHLVFPGKIDYVDLGSGQILASLAPGLDNVVRVKANEEDFRHETSLMVFLKSGEIYDFSVSYNQNLLTTLIQLSAPGSAQGLSGNLRSASERDALASKYHQSDKSKSSGKRSVPPSDAFLFLMGGTQDVLREVTQIIHEQVRPKGKITSVSAYKLKTTLHSVFSYRDFLFLDLEVENESNLSMQLSFPALTVRQRRSVRRSAVSEHDVKVLESAGFQEHLGPRKSMRMILAIDHISPSVAEKIEVDIHEEGALEGRSLRLGILRSDLERLRVLNFEYNGR